MFSRMTVYARDTVGVDRSPAQAFLGYPEGAQSMRINSAQLRRNGGGSTMANQLFVEGIVTVFDGFAAFNESVRVQIGDRALEFRPDKHGAAEVNGATFRVKNANEFGVVRGGMMEFELVLGSNAWPEVLAIAAQQPGSTTPRGGTNHSDSAAMSERTLRLSLDVARAHHVARATIIQPR
jgi:hypothetical protein